ncbi:N-acetyltransferase family protein [Streptomyces sp. MMCC 100]|uniref:GNAT family N-acetyltransferase n=1 Tax=Streptomyces sp. MMCC 100 TaxID=3163555 RepID=UPI003599D494
MTETLRHPAAATGTLFDPRSDEHARALTDLYRAYLLEEAERTREHAPGIPVAVWLQTALLSVDGVFVAFCSVDLKRRSVELVYVAPEHRGRGLASVLLADLARTCPTQLTVKAPLSPDGEALAASVGLPVVHPDAEQVEQGLTAQREMKRALDRQCRHRRGNPAAVCRRCLRALLTRSAEAHVRGYVALVNNYWRSPR